MTRGWTGDFCIYITTSTTVPRWLLVFSSEYFRYLTLVQRDRWSWMDQWELFFLTTPGFDLGTSGSLVLLSTTVPWWLLVFSSDNFRYLTLVQMALWWKNSDRTCERFSFGHTRVWTGDLWFSSPALYHCPMATSGFHLWQFQVFYSGAEGLVVVLFLLDVWEIFFLEWPGFEPGTSASIFLPQLLCHSDFGFSPLTISGI